jgi:Icc-related predicted phosphoesterase
MRIQIISDLHMEFQEPPLLENAGADVLILGGDICLAQHLYRHPRGGLPNNAENRLLAERYRRFFDHVNANWDHVIYVAGNHEHYSGRWDLTANVLREEMAHYPRIHFCDQDRVVIDGVVFLGVSLWSDFNGADPLTVVAAKDLMSDYRAITEHRDGLYHKLRPVTTLAKHRGDLEWLKLQMEMDKRPTVVVGHHCPSRQSIAPQYRQPQHEIMNGCFASALDEFIMDRPQIALWTHGHTHHPFDYMIGDTHIACNPHGYPGERTDVRLDVVIDL